MRKCEICDTSQGIIKGKNGKFKIDMCEKHYYQMQKYGTIRERTQQTPNEITINGDTMEIVLYNRNSIEVARAIADSIHYNEIKKYKWYKGGAGYCQSKIGDKIVYLHRLVTNAPEGLVVDHINHNTLDNRSNNLRICTQRDNAHNKIINANSLSGYNGVIWSKEFRKWKVQIKINKVNKFIGYYNDLQKAIDARLNAEDKHYGEFAYNKEELQ